jgi:hypothetical protein
MASASLQPSRAAAELLRTSSTDAERMGLQYLSVQALIESADTLLRVNDPAAARPLIKQALSRSDRLGLRLLRAKAHYLEATLLRLEKNRDARREYATALRLIDELTKDEGNQQLLKRSDLGALHADATRWATAG